MSQSNDAQPHSGSLIVRSARPDDAQAVWEIIEPVIRAGETYTLPPDMSRDAALAYWFSPQHQVFVAELHGDVVGTYYMRPNQQGGGSHVANCGYMTATTASGRGVARHMCEHSMIRAKQEGFRAMQFNFVVSTNERAVNLWLQLGFEVVGRLPGAFNHPRLGFVDALVMFQRLV